MPYATKWCTPAPPRPSGSSIRMAKLFVPSGTPLQDNCGDTFCPTQFGLFDRLFATFLGIIWPSLKVVEVKVNGSAACVMDVNARRIVAAATVFRRSCRENINVPPLRFFQKRVRINY